MTGIHSTFRHHVFFVCLFDPFYIFTWNQIVTESIQYINKTYILRIFFRIWLLYIEQVFFVV